MLRNIAEQLSGFSSLDNKMQTLRSKIQRLSSRESDVIKLVEDAEFRTGKKRKREVENWLDNVQMKKNKFQSLERDVQETSTIFQKPQLEERAEKMICEVTELVEQGKFHDGLLLDVHDTKALPLPTEKLIGHHFEENLEKVRNCLMEDNIMRIGIHGMGGSGKTTLADHVHNLLLRVDINVRCLTVSLDWSVDKLQHAIAKLLGLDLSKENERKKRAAILSRAVTGMKKFVLILDDVWENFSLLDVGIPCSMDGCKLIFTTRSLDVCRKMKCEVIIRVEPLLEDEAWNLFMEKLGHGMELSSEVIKIAKSMTERCCGLPLAIITMAGTMMGLNDIYEWRNAFEELKESITTLEGMEDEVFRILKFSYNRLKNEKLKECFLYCALYPEDERIRRDRLIEKFIAEGLIDKRKTKRQAQFAKGNTLLNELERACLLESCKADIYAGSGRCVKMHDLMREMALKIASCRFMIKAGVFIKEIPEEQEWKEDLERISLMRNIIKEIPTGMSPMCPRLSTLILAGNGSLEWIPYCFFEQMSGLRVLDLSGTGIVDLPNSVSDLENLTALFLRRCNKLRCLPRLGKLRALELLDLSHSGIKEVPQDLEMSVNLKCLYMEYSKIPNMLPSGILPKLSGLQNLRTGLIKVQGEELGRLEQLEEFKGSLDNTSGFNSFVKSDHFRRLNAFHLCVGATFYEVLYEKVVEYRCCSLKNEGEGGHVVLPHNIQFLRIIKCHDFNDIFPSLINSKVEDLKECRISDCDGIECILSLSSSSSSSSSWDQAEEEFPSWGLLLPSVEKLELDFLPKLSGLIKYSSRGGVTVTPPPGTLSNLKVLDIRNCPKMKKLLTPRLLQHLPYLETINVQSCDKMVEIIGDDDEGELTGAINYLSKLRELHLLNLPELESICKGVMACDSLEFLTILQCPKLKSLPFSLPLVNGQPSPPISLRKIWIQKGWWESLEWDHPNAMDVLQPFVVYW